MLFSPDLILSLHGSPPPQTVLDKRPVWFVLMLLLGATILLRMAAFDIMGGLLCGLLLLLAAVIVRDGMRELPKFSLIFGVLCGINFFFYIFPLLSNLVGGRSERRIDPVESVTYSNTQQLTYTLTVRTTPFFDHKGSVLYNVQSAGMLAMPLCMLLGAYLGIAAHQEVQRHSRSFFGADDGELGLDEPLAQGPAGRAQGMDGGAGPDVGAAVRLARQGIMYGTAGGRTAGSAAEEGGHKDRALAFQGRAHKLGD